MIYRESFLTKGEEVIRQKLEADPNLGVENYELEIGIATGLTKIEFNKINSIFTLFLILVVANGYGQLSENYSLWANTVLVPVLWLVHIATNFVPRRSTWDNVFLHIHEGFLSQKKFEVLEDKLENIENRGVFEKKMKGVLRKIRKKCQRV